MEKNNCKPGVGENATRCGTGKSEEFNDSVEMTDLGTVSKNGKPGSLEDDVDLINPDPNSMESRG